VWKGWSPSRKLAAVVVVLIALVAIGAAASSNGKSDNTAAHTPDTSSTGGAGKAGSGSGDSTTGGPGKASTTSTTFKPAPLPLAAKVTDTNGLHSGDKVSITVKADAGSFIYAIEMRLCRADSVLHNDGDELPTVTGQCATKPLAPGTDGYKIVESTGERREITADYIVGTGTDTYQMDDGKMNAVTCDAAHPCLLWVKYQIPNGFGFRTYPLTFS
jgi:hypothetical protein